MLAFFSGMPLVVVSNTMFVQYKSHKKRSRLSLFVRKRESLQEDKDTFLIFRLATLPHFLHLLLNLSRRQFPYVSNCGGLWALLEIVAGDGEEKGSEAASSSLFCGRRWGWGWKGKGGFWHERTWVLVGGKKTFLKPSPPRERGEHKVREKIAANNKLDRGKEEEEEKMLLLTAASWYIFFGRCIFVKLVLCRIRGRKRKVFQLL